MRTRKSFLTWTALAMGITLLGGIWLLGLSPAQELALEIPLGLIEPEIPADNSLTASKVALGRDLYFDARLSADD
ncbi:MAG: cytochrome-c peroxidase, partial [Candidatus Hydrogenedentota bacterium]